MQGLLAFNPSTVQGHPRLVQAISNLYTKLLNTNHTINPNTEVLVTDGAYEALYTGRETILAISLPTMVFSSNTGPCQSWG